MGTDIRWSVVDATDVVIAGVQNDPESGESLLRIRCLIGMAEAWLIGMSPPSQLLAGDFPKAHDSSKMEDFLNRLENEWEQVEKWATAHRHRLSYDERSRRFVLKSDSEGVDGEDPLTMPVPEKPFPTWRGAIPSRVLPED